MDPAATTAMRQRRLPVLRSKLGCVTCRQRKKKCNVVKPVCGECSRLGLACEWLDEIQSIAAAIREGKIKPKNQITGPLVISTTGDRANSDSPTSRHDQTLEATLSLKYIPDDPSILRASPTSVLQKQEDKQVYQFLKEVGHNFLKIPIPEVQALKDLNLFTVSYQLACRQRGLLYSQLAFAAAQLSFRDVNFARFVPVYYSKAIAYIREELDSGDESFPSEGVCGTAGLLSMLELCVFADGKARVSHLLGFHNLMQLRLQKHPDEFSPVKLLLEFYIHMLATSSTFYQRDLVGDRPIDYIDFLIELMKNTVRPLGPEIQGVQPIFIRVCWMLSYLRGRIFIESQYPKEVEWLTERLSTWEPEPRLLEKSNRKKLFVSRLFHAASSVFLKKLLDPTTPNSDPDIQIHVRQAIALLKAAPHKEPPMITKGWPLTVLCLAASREKDLRILQQPLWGLIYKCGLRAYTSVISFTDFAWGDGPESPTFLGLDALFDEDLLRTVHL